MRLLTEKMGIKADQVLAVGDGDNDLCLLEAAGTSVAFRPKTLQVRAAAKHVVLGQLSELLKLTGVERERVPA